MSDNNNSKQHNSSGFSTSPNGVSGNGRQKILQAVALEYDPNDTAPKIVATGKGRVAEKIIEAAKGADVPVHQDTKLADTLSKLDIGDYIPPELYEVVAEILVFVNDMEKLKGKVGV